jgi:hypothetical protein
MERKSEVLVEPVVSALGAMRLDSPAEPPLVNPLAELQTPFCRGAHIPLNDANFPWRSRAELVALYSRMYVPCSHYVHELPNDGIRKFLLVFVADEKETPVALREAMWSSVRDASIDLAQHAPIIASHHGRELRGPDGDDCVAFWYKPGASMC